jgi:hypothetical protein
MRGELLTPFLIIITITLECFPVGSDSEVSETEGVSHLIWRENDDGLILIAFSFQVSEESSRTSLQESCACDSFRFRIQNSEEKSEEVVGV